MEIVPLSVPMAGDSHTIGIPYNRRNVEEWSRLDSITGMMEKAKIETDRWSASNSSAAHNFAKVVDSRERNLPDGSLQQKQRKQMEVFQTVIPGGSMQVIRSQTVTTSSSTSWSSTNKAFGELKLPVNPLDLSSQKLKGNVGRSGSIGARRPPTRPRSLAGLHSDSLADVTKRCHQLHEEAKAKMFGHFANNFESDDDEGGGGVEITELDSPSEPSVQKTNLSRQKSCSNENINGESDDNSSMKRSSKFRRSLQIPKTSMTDDIPDWTNGKSLKERAAEIENLLRTGTSTNSYDKKDTDKNEIITPTVKTKSSFVSVEKLQEVRDRLRKMNSNEPVVDDIPDTIRVKEFVSDMEAKFGNFKTTINGTRSLQLRSNRSNAHNSEWFSRRKSYGFEKMENGDVLNGGHSNGESSTDSGIGNSSERFSKPTSTFNRFIEDEPSNDLAWTRKSPLPNREASRFHKNPWLSQLRGTKLVDRDWFNDSPDTDMNDSGVPESPKADEETKTFDFENNLKKQKKVEFCKTEVHFAAEPGRFNIVETDGKPPSSTVIRRSRRKGSGRTSPENYMGLPEVKFGDSDIEQKMLNTTTNAEKIDSLSRKIESELNELSKIVVELPVKTEELIHLTPSKLSDVQEESESLLKPRSILRNTRKSFLLGDDAPVWKSTVVLKNKRFDDVRRNSEERKSYSSDGESELQIRFRNLKRVEEPTSDKKDEEKLTVEVKRRSLPDDMILKAGLRSMGVHTIAGETVPVLSVAERVKQLKNNTYSSKIDFRSGEMTVLQNGTSSDKVSHESLTWPEFSRTRERASFSSVDVKNVSNPSVKRFSTSDVPNTTTRISINIPCKSEPTRNKPNRSWSFGAKSCESAQPQSASLVMQTIQDSEVFKKVKPVHEMVNKFDSLSRRPPRNKEQRRKTMPINYKAPKEYTHADLEEELKNFTEDLDKDFRDIYEQEIGNLKGSCRDLKKMFEQVCENSDLKSVLNGRTVDDKARTLPLAKGLRRNIKKVHESSGFLTRNKHYTVENIPKPVALKCNGRKTPPKSYDSEDSDVLADEEVRSYMSTGHDQGSDSDEPRNQDFKKKSFDRIRLQFKRLEERNHTCRKESKILQTSTPIKPGFVAVSSTGKYEPHYAAPPKVASISLRYEDDPLFSQNQEMKNTSDLWEKLSNTSSTISDTKPRERVSYLNGPSLSEKFTRRNSNSSLDNLIEKSATLRKDEADSRRSSFRSDSSKTRDQETKLKLDELTRAADEILVAVNGLTDESHVTSSEDEASTRKVLKKGKVTNLTTISEGKKTTITEARSQVTKEKSLSSRATRLLQRASHREAALAQRSSSEDIPANVEPVRKRVVRRAKPVTTVKQEKETPEKVCSRVKAKAKEKESPTVVHRERLKTVSSAAKEVSLTNKSNSKTLQITPERNERTKPSLRRELLSKADAVAEQAVKSRRTSSNHSSSFTRSDPSQHSLKKSGKVSMRRVEATRAV